MRIGRGGLAIAIVLAGCTSVPTSTHTGLQAVEFERMSWGRFLDRWTFSAPAAVTHGRQLHAFDAPDSAVSEIRRATLSARQVAALDSAIRQVSALRERPGGCDARATDSPYGTLRWVRDGREENLTWNGNCRAGPDHDLFVAVMEVDRLGADPALASPVVERHPGRLPDR